MSSWGVLRQAFTLPSRFRRILQWRNMAPPVRPFPTNFGRISLDVKFEEETVPNYVPSHFYPVHIGDVFASRYYVVGKLGFGRDSTVWLARDLTHWQPRYVTLKILVNAAALDRPADAELNTYTLLRNGPDDHPGRDAVRSLLDSFTLVSPDGGAQHQVLVHPSLWTSVSGLAARNPSATHLPKPVVAIILQRTLLALAYLHDECGIVHTDLKEDNIMFGLAEDDPVLEAFERAEREDPLPRKVLDDGSGRIIYVSRDLDVPTDLRPPVVCDFGSAVSGKEMQTERAQPKIYRAPEVILGVPWGYSIDIWTVGCLIWDMFEGRQLFYGTDPEHDAYRLRAHLAEMIAVLGPPPPELLARAERRSKFFDEHGTYNAGISLPAPTPLETLETTLEDEEEKKLFMAFVRKMLCWVPEERHTARQLLEDPWLVAQCQGSEDD